MTGAIYRADAEDDLDRIVDYIAVDNLRAAFEWLSNVRSTCELIATQPGIGQSVETARYGSVRRHALGSYVIYYWPTPDGIEVLRVLHGARDQGKLI